MELAILVYVVEKLSNNGGWLLLLFPTIILIVLATTFMKVDLYYSGDKIKAFWKNIFNRTCVKVLLVLWITWGIFMPSRETAIYMAGAYMLQQTVTHERTQQLGDAAYDATLTQLKLWSKESEQLQVLLDGQLKKALPQDKTESGK